MHDGSVEGADTWLRQHIGAYADWCAGSGDLLIVTFDEDDGEERNQIPTVFFGRDVMPGQYDERIDHYSVLRTIEALEGLPPLGRAADRPPITDVWRRPQ
jgi:acid phosphatase